MPPSDSSSSGGHSSQGHSSQGFSSRGFSSHGHSEISSRGFSSHGFSSRGFSSRGFSSHGHSEVSSHGFSSHGHSDGSSQSSDWRPEPAQKKCLPGKCSCKNACGPAIEIPANLACPQGTTESPVYYSNGEIQFNRTDISSNGFGSSWAHARSYNNQMSEDFDYGNGFNWLIRQSPYLLHKPDGSVVVVRSNATSLWFDYDAGTSSYIGKWGILESLVAMGAWNKQSPGPELPPDIVKATLAKYQAALSALVG